jgi:hypothetical protein
MPSKVRKKVLWFLYTYVYAMRKKDAFHLDGNHIERAKRENTEHFKAY